MQNRSGKYRRNEANKGENHALNGQANSDQDHISRLDNALHNGITIQTEKQ